MNTHKITEAVKFNAMQVEAIIDKVVPLVADPADHGFFRGVLFCKADSCGSSAEFFTFIAKKLTEKCVARLQDYYTYSFGDGWIAAVSVREAKHREKASGNFCGYNWMIDKIIAYGEIRA